MGGNDKRHMNFFKTAPVKESLTTKVAQPRLQGSLRLKKAPHQTPQEATPTGPGTDSSVFSKIKDHDFKSLSTHPTLWRRAQCESCSCFRRVPLQHAVTSPLSGDAVGVRSPVLLCDFALLIPPAVSWESRLILHWLPPTRIQIHSLLSTFLLL